MKKTNIFLLLIIVAALTSCTPDPAKYYLKTETEILSYMNENFPVSFTLVSKEVVDNNSFPKSITVKLLSDSPETGDELITVKHEYFTDYMFGFVNESFTTDFYCIYYKEKTEDYAEQLFEEYLSPKYAYRMFVDIDKSYMFSCEDSQLSFEDFSKKIWYIGNIDAVIKAEQSSVPKEDEDYWALKGRLDKESIFNFNIIFNPDVNLETVTQEEIKSLVN